MSPFTRFAHYFVEVARQGSLRRAANVLHVSASAVDRQILLAEEELGVRLFERLPKGLRLTSAGELLLGDLRRWQKEFGYTLERFDELQGLRRGHVSLAIIGALSDASLAAAISKLTDLYPGITLDIRTEENRHIADLVADAEVDFGILLSNDAVPALQVQTLAKVPLGLIVPPHHALAKQASVAFGQTLTSRHVVAAPPLMIHPQIAHLYGRHRLSGPQSIACNDVRMMRALVKQGAGIAIVSALDASEDVRAGNLAFIPLRIRQIRPLQMMLCVAPQRQLSKAAQLVVEHTAQAIRNFPGLESS